MTAAEILSLYQITTEQALNWIEKNIGSPRLIYDAAKQIGLTNDMLREIVGTRYPTVRVDDIRTYFNSAGLDAAALDGAPNSGAQRIDILALLKTEIRAAERNVTITLDGNGGAKDFVVDLANIEKYISDLSSIERTYAPSYLGASQVRITNFGYDDKLYLSGDSIMVIGRPYDLTNVKVKILGPMYYDVNLVLTDTKPLSATVVGINDFNQLPVGDIYLI